jgi:O-antigen/teichoic acid export membrane protein
MSLKKNVFANFAGSAWSALMGLAFVPFYIRLMGVESYGIVGVFASLMGMFAVLDLGLSQAMNREMARLSPEDSNTKRMVDTARTLEVVYWGLALLAGLVMVLFSNFIAYHWLNPENLSRAQLQQALWIIAAVIALRWPIALYMGGLNGLQRQVQVNILLCIIATIQGLGALAVLWFVAPTIQAFFIWQAVIALVQVIALRFQFWRNFSREHRGTFNSRILKDIWRFAAGMTGISLLATILTQLDKAILSKLLTLTEFGYYTFAATVAAILSKLVGPIFTAYYPRLTELVAKNDRQGLIKAYHQGSQLMAVVILPITFVLAFFSKEILELWTHNPNIVLQASLLVSLLTIGNALNGLMHMPYALQLAHGWTNFAFLQNVVAVVILAPAIYFATLRWGSAGAAAVWIGLNTSYTFIGIQVMHRRFLRAEKWRWYMHGLIYPAIGVLGVGIVFRLFLPERSSSLVVLIYLIGCGLTMTVTAGSFTPYLRSLMISKSKHFSRFYKAIWYAE